MIVTSFLMSHVGVWTLLLPPPLSTHQKYYFSPLVTYQSLILSINY